MSTHQKPLAEFTITSVNDVLEEIGWKNTRILLSFATMSLCWIFTGVSILVESFIDDPECDFSSSSNLTDFCLERKSTSMISEFELYGSRSYLKHSLTTAFMIGSIFGGPLVSFFSDKYGRKKAVFWSVFTMGICSCGSIFANDISIILLFRFLEGASYDGIAVSGWILANESVPSILRPIATFVFGFTWVIGYCLIALLAYYIKEWRIYMFIPGVPCLIFCFFVPLVVPESLHYLVEKGRIEQAKKWVRDIGGSKVLRQIDWILVMKNGEQMNKTKSIKES